MRRVLVTGATGFIGYEVARQLAARGLRPRLLVRRPSRGALLAALDAELVQGDLGSRVSLQRAVGGVDTIIHLAARAVFEEYALVRPTIADGSERLMELARDAGVDRLVFASSLLVYESRSKPITAKTPAGTRLGYGRAKLEAEAALRRLAAASGIGLAIVRLPHVYGARDLMFDQVRRGRVYFPGSGHNVFSHLHVVDAARLLIAVAEAGWSGVSPVADRLPASWNEFFAVVKSYYPRFQTVGVPRPLARFGTRLLTPLRRLRGEPSVYTPEAVDAWNENLVVEPGTLWNALRIEPRFPTIHEGIPAALDECVAFRWRHPVLDRVR